MFKKVITTLWLIVVLLLIGGAVIFVTQNQTSVKNETPDTNLVTSTPIVKNNSGEDVIRRFFQLINDQKQSEAVAMLSKNAAPDEATRQAWGVNFNSLKSVTVKSLKKTSENTYLTTLAIEAETERYNWSNGENLRWITLVKEDGIWKIEALSTGP